MKLQSCRKSENLLAVGLTVVFFFMPYLVAGRKPASQPFLPLNPQPCWSAMNPNQTVSNPLGTLTALLATLLISFLLQPAEASNLAVTYTQQQTEYSSGTFFNGASGGAGWFNQGTTQLGLYAHNSGSSSYSVAWRPFLTQGNVASGTVRKLQVGDVFAIGVSATRAYGEIGFSLNASGTSGSSWANRQSGTRLNFNLDGPDNGGSFGNWYVNASGSSPSFGVAGTQGTFNDFYLNVRITSTTTADAWLTTGGTTYNAYNLTMLGSGNIDTLAVYLQDDYDGANNQNIYWEQPAYVTNSGLVQLGYNLTSGTITPGLISDGLEADSTSITSPNAVVIGGNSGTKVVLNQANIYTGGTTINNNATLEVSSTETAGTSGPLGKSGTITLGGGTLQFSSANTFDYSSRFSTAASQAYNIDVNGQSVSFGSALTSSGGSLTLSDSAGGGKLTLSGANTYSGTTTISAGTLQLNTGGTLGSGNVQFTGSGSLIFNETGPLAVNNRIYNNGANPALTQNGSGTTTLGGSTDNSGAAITINAGTVVLGKTSSSSVHALGGGTDVVNSGGTLQLGGSGGDQIYDGTAVTINSGGVFDLAGQSETITTLNGTGGYVTNSSASTASTLTLNIGANTADNYNGTIATASSGGNFNLVLTNAAGGTAALYSLNNSNSTFTGSITVIGTGGIVGTNGVLGIYGDGALGNANNTLTLTNGGGLCNMTNPTTSGTWPGHLAFTLGSGRSIVLAGTAGGVFRIGYNDTCTINSTISGTGAFTKSDNGNLILNAANTFSGNSTIANIDGIGAGVLTLGNSLALQNSTLNYGSSGGNLSFGSLTSATLGGLQGNQALGLTNNSGAAVALSIGNNNTISTNYTSVLSGPGSLTKIGTGTNTFSGTNTYTGNTTISAGTLALSGSGSITNSPQISIATGATLDVSAVTPSGYSLNGSGTLALNINKTGSTLTQGQLVLGAKNLTYGGAFTVTASGGTLAAGDSFNLITNTGTKSGCFSMVSVPSLASGISWDTNKLATTGVLDIYTFTNVTLTLTTPVNSNAVISATKLLNHSGSSRGTAYAAAVSMPGHGTSSLSSGALTYSPTANYSGSDTFTCTFQDGHGWQTITVNVTVGNGTGQGANSVYTGTSGGNFVAQFAGIPGYSYTVQSSSSANGPWTKLANYTAPTDNSLGFGIGVFQVTDPMSNGAGFYRTVYPAY